jgi:hypothetical protein
MRAEIVRGRLLRTAALTAAAIGFASTGVASISHAQTTASKAPPAKQVAAPSSVPVKAPLPEIVGNWKVSSVIVLPGPTPEHVLNANDPIYVDAVVEISKDWMAWRPRKGGDFGDVCMAPKLDGFALKCSYGTFGPKDAKVALFNGLLIVGWYDNVQLVLQRVD